MALHDLGKFSRSFQAKAEVHWPPVLGPLQAKPDPGHDSVGFALLDTLLAAAIESLFEGWNGADRAAVLRAVCGHHGRPPLNDVPWLGQISCAVCQAAATAFVAETLALLDPPPLPPPADGAAGHLDTGRVPRACGDEPRTHSPERSQQVCAPRMRGSTGV